MKSKLALLLLSTLVSVSARADVDISAGSYSWSCSAGNEKVLDVTLVNSQLKTLFVDGYEIVREGNLLSNREIGPQVRRVHLNPVSILSTAQAEIEVSLQDYSDIQGWKAQLAINDVNAVSGSAILFRTFQSSDGDDELHTSTEFLECNFTQQPGNAGVITLASAAAHRMTEIMSNAGVPSRQVDGRTVYSPIYGVKCYAADSCRFTGFAGPHSLPASFRVLPEQSSDLIRLLEDAGLRSDGSMPGFFWTNGSLIQCNDSECTISPVQ
jgi:hypothetical protein